MNTVLFRTAMLLVAIFGFSTNLLAAPPSKPPPVPAPVVNAVVTDVPGQLEIVGSNLSVNSVVPTVRASFVDASNVLQTVQLPVLASSSTAVAAALPSNLRAGNYLVNVQTTGGTSNGYDFTVAAPAAPASIPNSNFSEGSASHTLDLSQNSTLSVIALCGVNSVATGGGYDQTPTGGSSLANIAIKSLPHVDGNGVPDGWEVDAQSTGLSATGTYAITAYVNCLKLQ